MNLCEILGDVALRRDTLESLLSLLRGRYGEIGRIYIGSDFCSQFFLGMSDPAPLFDYCREHKLPVTLVLPVFSQKDLERGKNRADALCRNSQGVIDEITVNDLGMLAWCRERRGYRLSLGRLFFKDPRDCRVPELGDQAVEPGLLTQLSEEWWNSCRIRGIELDPTNKILDLSRWNRGSVTVGIHEPYCYMTTGNICKFGSIHRPVEQKFRPNHPCGRECLHVMDSYSGHIHGTDQDVTLYRMGRTLYYRAEPVDLLGVEEYRRIYFPLEEWREIRRR